MNSMLSSGMAREPTRDERVTVIIVNFNGGLLVERCLAALAAQDYPDFETIVVDNASSDGSAERIAAHFPAVRLMRAERNLGFAAANNLALRECTSTRWVALLNPDAYPQPNWLGELMHAAASHPECACFASLQLLEADVSRADGVGDAYHASGLCYRIGHGQSAAGLRLVPGEVFSPCAAAALYRGDRVREVGGFDEDFFCYCEDVDLGFRLRLAGYACLLVPAAVVVHTGSGVVGRQSDFQIYHGHRNLVWVFVKNMPGWLFWLLLPGHVALNVLSIFWFLVRGHGRTILRAKWDALRALPRMWQRRRLIQASRRVSLLRLAQTFDWWPGRR